MNNYAQRFSEIGIIYSQLISKKYGREFSKGKQLTVEKLVLNGCFTPTLSPTIQSANSPLLIASNLRD
jgi:hypothetical protein